MSDKIAVLGAFDRFNYGDLLFPIIIEEVLKKYKIDCQIEYYGLTESNLRRYGGKATLAYDKLYGLPNGSILIIAGGEVLSATWFDMEKGFLSRKIPFLLKSVKNIIGNDLLSSISFYLFGQKIPFVLNPADFNNSIKIIYNAVGGSSLNDFSSKYKKNIASRLSKSTFLSVRDIETKNILDTEYVDAELAPDSAILISDFFPFIELEQKINSETKEIIRSFPNGYICFQISRYLAVENELLLSKELEKIYTDLGYGIVLLPIGREAFHEDSVALKKIQSFLNIPSIVPNENSIYDIMVLIGKSELFIGTSLHGCITAISYDVRYIGLTKYVPKLSAYLETWNLPEISNFKGSYDQLSQVIKCMMSASKENLTKKRNELIYLSYKNFDKILGSCDLAVTALNRPF